MRPPSEVMLTIRPGSPVRLRSMPSSGRKPCVAFSVPKSVWKPYKQAVRWETHESINNVFGQLAQPQSGADGIVLVGLFDNATSCAAAAQAVTSYTAWTYHEPSFGGSFAKHCYGRTDGAWAPVGQLHVTSGLLVQQNVWSASLDGLVSPSELSEGMPGLRINGERVMPPRARTRCFADAPNALSQD